MSHDISNTVNPLYMNERKEMMCDGTLVRPTAKRQRVSPTPPTLAPPPKLPHRAIVNEKENTDSSEVILLLPVASSIESLLDPPPAPFVSTHAVPCLVLDVDETLGDFQTGSLLFNMFLKLCAAQPSVEYFVKFYLEKGAARPGLKRLLQRVAHLKAAGRISELLLWTSASNLNGWVTFLSKCLQHYANLSEYSIDRVLTREHATKRHRTGRIMKDLRLISTDTSKTVMVDDKPSFVQYGRVIRVNDYSHHVPIDGLVEALPCSDLKKEEARRALWNDHMLHPQHAREPQNDSDLDSVTELITSLF